MTLFLSIEMTQGSDHQQQKRNEIFVFFLLSLFFADHVNFIVAKTVLLVVEVIVCFCEVAVVRKLYRTVAKF